MLADESDSDGRDCLDSPCAVSHVSCLKLTENAAILNSWFNLRKTSIRPVGLIFLKFGLSVLKRLFGNSG
jgi:hypothetical protein